MAQEGPPPGPPGEGHPPGPPGEGHHPGPQGEGHHPGPQKELTEEQEGELLIFAQQYVPTRYEQLMEIKEIEPMEYKKTIVEQYPMMVHLKKIQQKEPEVFEIIVNKEELDAQSMKLARSYKGASDESEKSAIESELKVVLDKLFDLRQKEEKLKADKMEEELAKIREILVERDTNKELIVQNRIDELTGKSKYIQW